ncbi:MAG: DinB family protein [Planctomycetes bacterium]|nr:DinB family protein [Planctomycetota bacterium]
MNTRVEAVSGWSPAQHLYHVVLATDLGLGNVLALVRGKGILIRESGAIHPETEAILCSDSIPRGAAQAPRMVQPNERVEREQVEIELTNVDRSLQELESLADSIATSPGWIKHQVLGPLNASHWMRFCSLHAQHHLAIIEEIESALVS